LSVLIVKGHILRALSLVIGALLLSGCQIRVEDGKKDTPAARAQAPRPPAPAVDMQSLLFADAEASPPATPVSPALQAQVTLDALGFSPGVIDGKEGESFRLALKGFQQANGIDESGKLDKTTADALTQARDIPATRTVRIPAAFAAGPFVPDFPKDAAEQAKLPALVYRNLMEALAERFHTTTDTLIALNSPTTKVGAGQVIRVPNVPDVDPAKLGPDERGWNHTLQTLGVAPDQPVAAKIVVDKSEGVLRVYDRDDRLIAQFPATMGSSHDPLPVGTWKIQGVSRNPDFHYSPKLFWDVSDSKADQLLKPGPNGPVGVVWLDLSKPHYGIHGTGEPQTIGRAESHGCIRLTNWDAARLAQMVKAGVPAILQE
jgi:lipoprotein-anchoring transpeptidase ErfK/SrfK